MNYLEIVRLTREPFSNSPDPDNFFPAETHQLCLNRIEIAVRLKRGLNVVYGPVGTGKSTLCRRLFAKLSEDGGLFPKMLLDAGGMDGLGFARTLLDLLGDEEGRSVATQQEAVGRLQARIFDLALEKGRIPVLFIDEGQKLTPEAMEVLRVLLNFETNTEKLIQIVIFAQPEFREAVDAMPNFKDRINEIIELKPLTVEETRGMIAHRLKVAGSKEPDALFTDSAVKLIHESAQGHPRRMLRLAHLSLLAMIMAGKDKVDDSVVRAQLVREGAPLPKSRKSLAVGAAVVTLALAAGASYVAFCPSLTATVLRERLTQFAAFIVPSSAQQKKTAAPQVQPAAPAVQTTEKTKEAASSAAPGEFTGATLSTVPAQVATKMPDVRQPAVRPLERPKAGEQAKACNLKSTVVRLESHLPLEEVAKLFYGSEAAVEVLRAKNPAYDASEAMRLVRLPSIRFDVPAYLRQNSLLAFREYSSVQQAYDDYPRLAAENPRFLVRHNEKGQARYYWVARTSFSDATRVWRWLDAHRPSVEIEPKVLPPFKTEEWVHVLFPKVPDVVRGVDN